MQTRYIADKNEWEELITQFPEANFLQSWQWGVFQESLGKKILRICVESEQQHTALAELVIEDAKRGRYAAVAGGPLLNWQNTAFVTDFFKVLIAEAKKSGCIFLRFRPQEVETKVSSTLIKQLDAIESPMHLTADLTLQLDLTQSLDELLAQMRKNTRYEVRKADKLGIETSISTNPAEVTAFYKQQLAVAERHNFIPFAQDFLENQFAAFAADNQVALVHAHHQGQLLATAFIIFYNKEAVYHYGISTEANAKLPGAYAAQWRAIQEAKERGCLRYNFWGIAPPEATEHRFAGVSLFKRGFGGTEVAYLPAHDIQLSPLYWLTWGFENYRKWARKL